MYNRNTTFIRALPQYTTSAQYSGFLGAPEFWMPEVVFSSTQLCCFVEEKTGNRLDVQLSNRLVSWAGLGLSRRRS